MADSEDDEFRNFLGRVRLEVSETAKSGLFCFGCSGTTPIADDADVVGAMLRGIPPPCSKCAQPVEVWKLLVASMTVGNQAIAFGIPLGLRHTVAMYRVPVASVKELDLVAEGVPADGQLFRVVHQTSPLQPGKLVDLDALDSSEPPRFRYKLLGLWLGEPPIPDDIQGQTSVLWAQHDVDDAGRRELFAALEAFSNGRVRDAILPANVAVELPLGRVVDDYFSWVGIGKDHRRRFLRGGGGFGNQLNILAPAVARHLNAPVLPEGIRTLLNRLREMRNDAAHAGISADLDPTEVGSVIAAAIVGFRYARLLGETLAAIRIAG